MWISSKELVVAIKRATTVEINYLRRRLPLSFFVQLNYALMIARTIAFLFKNVWIETMVIWSGRGGINKVGACGIKATVNNVITNAKKLRLVAVTKQESRIPMNVIHELEMQLQSTTKCDRSPLSSSDFDRAACCSCNDKQMEFSVLFLFVI